jgi:hypothetical protein
MGLPESSPSPLAAEVLYVLQKVIEDLQRQIAAIDAAIWTHQRDRDEAATHLALLQRIVDPRSPVYSRDTNVLEMKPSAL